MLHGAIKQHERLSSDRQSCAHDLACAVRLIRPKAINNGHFGARKDGDVEVDRLLRIPLEHEKRHR
ncbi:hypothetical protein D3C86_2031800 [compost metagenome]